MQVGGGAPAASALAQPGVRNPLLALARECAHYLLPRAPHVRMLAVSGSLTREEHRGSHSDVDFFVVARQGRIWEAFFGCLLQGWRFARRAGLPRTFFCFNYLVSEAYPEEIDLSRPEYVREFLRLEVLAGHGLYAKLLDHFRDRLQRLEPVLYEQARHRALATAPRPPARVGATASFWAGVYRLLCLPFIGIAKWMEHRRRRRFPGGYIYSNSRVIRSHFRRSFNQAVPEADGMPQSKAFSNVADTYDDQVVSSPANLHMRSQVHSALAELVRPGMQVLDLGAGTGVDAVWLAQRGARVLAVDAAPAMVRKAGGNVTEAGVADRVEVRQLAVEALASLLPEHARQYDLILANFGVLNLSGDPGGWAPVTARLLKPGGYLVVNVMNRFSAWEFCAGLLRGRLAFALRRLRGDPVRVGGVSLSPALYSPRQFISRIATYFRVELVQGLCVFAPPPAMERLARGWPRLWALLCSLDRRFGHVPVIRAAGDHFLAVLQQRSKPLFTRRRMGFVTAAPVVSDVNGDGSPEVIVASGRLHVLNWHGNPLGGWPRRIGGPMASTPWVHQANGSAILYVGSDDDRLYAVTADGSPAPGFPVLTGGDVFSSPLVAAPPDGSGPRIIFGSDDGCVHAVDSCGRPLPGWPLRTGGFVSASPAEVVWNGEPAVVIGSWDGMLYAVSPGGSVLSGWPRPLGFPVWSSAATADLDGDGEAEVLVAAHHLYAFHADGRALQGFPVRLGGYAVGSPAVGDIDGDGRLEVVIGSDRLYAVRDDGKPLPGFPADLGAYIWASPVLADVDGDGYPEILVGDFDGHLWAVTCQGRILPGYPQAVGRRITAAATAADLDGDRHLEVIVASADGRLAVLPTECPDDPGRAPWPTFLHGRHGLLRPADGARAAAGVSVRRDPGPGMGTASTGPAPDGPAPALAVHTRPGIPRPFTVTEIHLSSSSAVPIRGMLHYTVNTMHHPSPFLAAKGRHFALIQPLPPLKQVDFWCELTLEGGEARRIPQEGAFRFHVGLPGLRRSGKA